MSNISTDPCGHQPEFVANHNGWFQPSPYVSTCGFELVRWYPNSGIWHKAKPCDAYGCSDCYSERAARDYKKIGEGPARHYFGDFLIASNSIRENAKVLPCDSPRTWYCSVESWYDSSQFPSCDHLSTIRARVQTRATSVNAEYLTIGLTDRVVIFATRDLSIEVKAGMRGQPAKAPHSGLWFPPHHAGMLLHAIFAAGDVLSVSKSQGWSTPEAEEDSGGVKGVPIGRCRPDTLRRTKDLVRAALEAKFGRSVTDTEAAKFEGMVELYKEALAIAKDQKGPYSQFVSAIPSLITQLNTSKVK